MPGSAANGVIIAVHNSHLELCKIPSAEENPENLPGVNKLGNYQK